MHIKCLSSPLMFTLLSNLVFCEQRKFSRDYCACAVSYELVAYVGSMRRLNNVPEINCEANFTSLKLFFNCLVLGTFLFSDLFSGLKFLLSKISQILKDSKEHVSYFFVVDEH